VFEVAIVVNGEIGCGDLLCGEETAVLRLPVSGRFTMVHGLTDSGTLLQGVLVRVVLTAFLPLSTNELGAVNAKGVGL
jgi:hypothetical protein